MIKNPIPILHVDGSLSEYIDQKGCINKVAGVGGYLIIENKIIDVFHKKLENEPYLNHHEEYAIIEGLKWIKNKKIDQIQIKTDSLPSIHLFKNIKKNITKEDKFFLSQYLMLEYCFEKLEIEYQKRDGEDLSHKLSRKYIPSIPKDVIRLHCENSPQKSKLVCSEAVKFNKNNLEQKLCNYMNEIYEIILK